MTGGTFSKKYIKNKKMALAAAVWMGVIFLMSAFPADISSDQSDLIVDFVMKVLAPFTGQGADLSAMAEKVSLIVRKCAHMTEYAVLAVLLAGALGTAKQQAEDFVGAVRPAFVCAVLYAATDEIHQIFVAGRAGRVTDVMIDAGGALIGLILMKILKIDSK